MIEGLNKLFESRVRLGVMSALMVNDWMDFNSFKELLGVTDGNLASHLSALEKHGFVEIQKQFIGRKPRTSYRATVAGRKEFKAHLDALERLIRGQR